VMSVDADRGCALLLLKRSSRQNDKIKHEKKWYGASLHRSTAFGKEERCLTTSAETCP